MNANMNANKERMLIVRYDMLCLLEDTVQLLADEVEEGKWINHGSILAHLTHISHICERIRPEKGEKTKLIAIKARRLDSFSESIRRLNHDLVTRAYADRLCYSIGEICENFKNILK